MKRCRKTSNTLEVVVEDISQTSGLLEWASTARKYIFSKEGPSEVYVYSLPWSRRPDPGVEWSYCWQLFDGLAGHTGLDQKLNVFVETRPPDVAPSQCFHPRYAGVITVVIYAYIYEASLVRKIYFHKMFSMAKLRKLCTSKICHYTVYYKYSGWKDVGMVGTW